MRTSEAILRRLIMIAVVCILPGCTVGPDFETPEIDWRDQWEADLYDSIGVTENQADLDLDFWWHLFDDPVLNELIDLAHRENPSMLIAGLRVLETRAALGIARGSQYPQLQQLTGDAIYQGSTTDGEAWQDDINSGVGLNVGWELDFWGKYRRGVESADAAFFASIANQQDFQVLLSAQVADLYYAYRSTQLRMEIARSNAAIQRRSFDITRQLFESGEQSELDLQQAKTQYMATLSVIPDLESTLRKLNNAMCALMGRPPGALLELDETVQDLPMVDPAIVKDIPAQFLVRRPDIRAAVAQVAAQTAQVGVAEAAKYPSISLFGNVGWSGSTLGLGIGPSLTWNIFNYGRLENNVRVQDARLQQAIENFRNVALQAAREIDDAAISIVKTREQTEPQHQSTVAAERSLDLANTRYREGYAGFQRVIEAQRAAAAQNDRELVNQSNHLSAIISFYKAIGGGWHAMTIEELVPAETRETMEARTNWGDLLRNPVPAAADSLSSADSDESDGTQ